MAPREWDATTYDQMAAPMTTRGTDAVARLTLRGDETVLDAGCGTGQVTTALLERLPRGRVIALDASRRMLAVARERLGDDARITFVRADLGQPLPLAEPVDAVVSTSTFHWVRDHDALFRHLAAALRPGGQLVVDCGGAGNIASILRILEDLGETEHPWTYATPEETRARLDAAGFAAAETWRSERPTPLAPDELERYLATVVLGTHVAELGEERGAVLVREVAERMDEPLIDYVRLNVDARR
ncbi:MAG: Methyltransferase type 12 [Conexibacter sp.]|jgi:trans-aconitate 2-methyltransferase|nr:Methyltransferase type 12 [Conexibacter sp.]